MIARQRGAALIRHLLKFSEDAHTKVRSRHLSYLLGLVDAIVHGSYSHWST